MIATQHEVKTSDRVQSFSYSAYGLGLQSSIPIPEFAAGGNVCDVTIDVRPDCDIWDYVPLEVTEQSLALQVTPKEAIVYLQGAGVFIVQAGSRIVIIPAVGASQARIRRCLIGTIMAIVLYQRGQFVLHASAVNLDGVGVAFVGRSGEGKSSWAGALHAQGYELMTDDVAAVSLHSQPAILSPGFPQIKLSPVVADSLGYEPHSPMREEPAQEQRGHCLIQNFCQVPLPIKGIYVLTSGPEFKIEFLAPAKALIELMRHSTLRPFFEGTDANLFLQCATLAKACPIYRLQRPRNLTMLPQLVRLMADHFTSECLIARV